MKNKKEITEYDLEILQRHIDSTKIQMIDLKNQLNTSLGKIRGTMVLLSLLLVISLLIGYLLWKELNYQYSKRHF